MCRRQLADYQNNLSEFAARNITVIAASVDSQQDAEKVRTELDITFPIGYGLPPQETADLTGAFYDAEDEEPYFHATGFIINDAGKVEIAVYSTGSLGRLTVEDALRYTNNRKQD